MKYLDLTGLSEVWANIKSYISSKIPTKTSQLQNDSNYVTTSQLPSKTSQLINDSDFTTNAKLTSKANDSDVVHKSGDEIVNGTKIFTSAIVNNSPHIRHVFGDYGIFWRHDNINLYLLLTNKGDPYGDWNNFRPLTVNLATGICNISGTAGGVAWTNVSGRPTKLSQFTNDSGYLTSGNVVDRTSNQNINGEKTFINVIQTNSGLYTKDNISLRIQNIDNIETNPTQQIGSCGIGFTNKDASAWFAYNRYFRTTVDGIAYLQLHCLPIKKSDGSYTIGGYLNIYNTGFARVNDPLSIDPNANWNNNNIVTSNWVRKYFSNSIGDYWSKSATGNQYSHSTFSYLSTIDKATTNTSWTIDRPFRMVDKNNSIELFFVEYGYKSDLAYTRLFSNHNTGGSSNLTIHTNGISYFDNCSELWLVNKHLDSYNTTPSNEIDTQIWFMDKNSYKYATLQTDYFPNGTRQFALTHKSLRTGDWIGLNMKTSPTDDVIQCQPRFQAQDRLLVQNTDSNKFTDIGQGWIELSSPDFSGIDFKHAGNQDYLARLAFSTNNIFFLETKNGAPIWVNGKNIVRSVNGVNADNNGNVNIQGFSNGIGEIIQGYYVPNGIVQKSGSVYFGTLVQPQPGATLNDFRDINITITDEFHPEAGKIYDYNQIFSTLYLHSYDSEYAVGATFESDQYPKINKDFGGWIKVAGSNLVRNSGRYLCTSVSPYGYAVTLRYNLTMTCEMLSRPGGSYPRYGCKIVGKTVPQNQMTVTSKATFMRVG